MAEPSDARAFDVIAIGRSSVDLYGQQIGTRLEDVGSFAKSVGGCPANIAIGSARLSLKSALVTRVGNEQMGRFIREQLAREGVDIRGVATDPERLTALILLSVQGKGLSPIFYRTDCADMALSEADIDEAMIASSRAVLVTGTHFSRPDAEAAQRKAMQLASTARTFLRHRLPPQSVGRSLYRGVLLLGLAATEQELALSFALAAKARTVRGFAVGRTVFEWAARAWLAGEITDDEAVVDMADRFASLTEIWSSASRSRG